MNTTPVAVGASTSWDAAQDIAPGSGRATAATSRRWRRKLPLAIALADGAAVSLALVFTGHLGYGSVPSLVRVGEQTIARPLAALLVVLGWSLVLAAHGAYRPAVLGSVPEEPRRILRAGIALLAVVAVVDLVWTTNVPGRWVVVVAILATILTLAVRFVGQRVVHHAREHHRWMRRAVVYGARTEADALAKLMATAPQLGVDVVTTCAPEALPHMRTGSPRDNGRGKGTPSGEAEWRDDVLGIVASTGADVLAVAAGTPLDRLRALVWGLEGSGVDVLVAPAVTDVVRHGVTPHPLGAFPLLRVEGCRLSGARLVAKVVFDRVGAALLLLLLSPVILAAALAVKLSSPGPVLYRQMRIGQHGRPFSFLKLRTMVCDADARLAELTGCNESDGLLFKIHDDPRITALGRLLRRASIDELPQLWNVVRGDMSLVGPRPLPVSPDAFCGDARRRLRVKPGVTGLWQVSGRSDLSWEDTVRLDMDYVDRWSLWLDLRILLRTPAAVVRARGAY
ncbi:MAG TPA: sugar transferase [Acidimicrobiales bacterium]